MKRNCTAPRMSVHDRGPDPFALNLTAAARQNTSYRKALWTGRCLQLTVMSIPTGGEIGLEVHPDTDQFFGIESGSASVMTGPAENRLNRSCPVSAGLGVFVPAGTWHNIINTGSCPLKLYTIYAPPHHPHATVQATKAIADRQHH